MNSSYANSFPLVSLLLPIPRHIEIVPAPVDRGQPYEDPEASRDGPAPAGFCLVRIWVFKATLPTLCGL